MGYSHLLVNKFNIDALLLKIYIGIYRKGKPSVHVFIYVLHIWA